MVGMPPSTDGTPLLLSLRFQAVAAPCAPTLCCLALPCKAGMCLFVQEVQLLPCTPSPQFVCYCEKIWYSVVRCRTAEAQNMTLPVPW